MQVLNGSRFAYHTLQAVIVIPAVVLPFISIWFLPIVLPALGALMFLQSEQKKKNNKSEKKMTKEGTDEHEEVLVS